jgi:CheY-like chemotaxis protein/HPt (histidine-containing phosphotransfer) domain-containing protein
VLKEAASAAEPAPIIIGALAGARNLRGLKVLIVDDDPTNCCILEHHLQREEVLYESVGSGRIGLAAARAAAEAGAPFDVVLLDYQMPEMNGMEFLHELRLDPAIATTHCIVLSTLGDRAAEASELGVAAWLTKPVSKAQLQSALARIEQPNAVPIELAASIDSPLDEAALSALRELMGDDFTDVIRTFFSETVAHLTAMDGALEKADLVVLGRCAHSLMSSSDSVGAVVVRSLAQTLEAHARSSDQLEEAGRLVAALRAAFDELRPQLEAAIEVAMPTSGEVRAVPIGERMRILLAEDDPVTRKRMTRLLNQAGYEVDAVADGTAALDRMTHHYYPMLVTDWEMPGMDGIDLCKAVRSLALDGYVYTLLLTGRDAKAHVIAGLEAGADDYLVKPIHEPELIARLNTGRRILSLEHSLKTLELERSQAQKLESVGRLAAGVAHEINTPVQFVSDNVQFVRTSLPEIAAAIHAFRNLQQTVQTGGDVAGAASLAAAADKAADLDYIMENAPLAIESAIDGLGRIATIVRSMKEFAHPDQASKSLADLNQAIRGTLVIAHNEYKYVAELDAQYGELPAVPCYLGEINQVILNLLVNAAHAISDVVKDSSTLGKLTVRTRLDGEAVEISIADTGTGIPEAARDKIFDPFFTTKEVGSGTGQGLAIARSVIVNKHGGTLRFETECGKGTTFIIRLPINVQSGAADVTRAVA